MIEIVICDDNAVDLEKASKIVGNVCLCEAVGYNVKTYSSALQMLEETHTIDIGILDIAMRELNGIELGRKLKERFPDIQLIYTTSYEQYCKQVINQVHAFSFLTKPLVYENVKEQIIDALDAMKNDTSGRKREFYKVTTEEKQEIDILKLDLKDILYFEYIKAARKIKIVCGNHNYEFVYVMEKLTDELRESGFEVNCRGMLVNMRHIRRIKGYSIYMDNGQILALSQKRKSDFVKRMNVFIHDQFN